MSGILVVKCPNCGTTRVITEEHHICTDCGYDFFEGIRRIKEAAADKVLVMGYDLNKDKIVVQREFPKHFIEFFLNLNIPGTVNAFTKVEISKDKFDELELAYVLYCSWNGEKQ